MSKRTKIVVTALTMMSSSAAFAAAQSSAQISNLRFTVIDLTPDNGIAPDFRFLPFDATNHPNEAGYSPGPATASAGLATISWDGKSQTAVAPTLFAPAAFGQGGGGQSYSRHAFTSGASFELSAGTKLIITADASLSAWASPSVCAVYYGAANQCPNGETEDLAQATAAVTVTYQQPLVPSNESFRTVSTELSANVVVDFAAYFSLPPAQIPEPSSDVKSQALSLELSNTTSQEIRGNLQLRSSVFGYGLSSIPLQPLPFSTDPVAYKYEVIARTANSTTYALLPQVPEPSTWATMLLGMFGVAAVARNKRRSANQEFLG